MGKPLVMALVAVEDVAATTAQRRTIDQVLSRESLKGRPGWARALAELEADGAVRLEFNRHRALYVQHDGRLTRK